MFHLIRNHLMEQDDSEPFVGAVETDETFVGGQPHAYDKRTHAQKLESKTIVWGAVERGGHVRAEVIPVHRSRRYSASRLRHVKGGSRLISDGFPVYRSFERVRAPVGRHSAGLRRWRRSHDTIEGFWALIKTGIRGAHHSAQHLQGYLNEYAWRYNHHDDTADVKTLLASACRHIDQRLRNLRQITQSLAPSGVPV